MEWPYWCRLILSWMQWEWYCLHCISHWRVYPKSDKATFSFWYSHKKYYKFSNFLARESVMNSNLLPRVEALKPDPTGTRGIHFTPGIHHQYFVSSLQAGYTLLEDLMARNVWVLPKVTTQWQINGHWFRECETEDQASASSPMKTVSTPSVASMESLEWTTGKGTTRRPISGPT